MIGAGPRARRSGARVLIAPGSSFAGRLLPRVAATVTALGATVVVAAGCADPCCTTDGFAINLEPAGGAPESLGLVASARYPGGAQSFRMSIDTSSPLVLFRSHGEKNQMVLRDFDILDAATPVVRGQFRGIEVLPLDLLPPPDGPDAIFGGLMLQSYSVQFDFAARTMTFWSRQGASDGFLNAAGFAVIDFNLLGGAELTAETRPDFLGLTGPVEVPPTRVVLRACAGPEAFDPVAGERTTCCQRIEAVTRASGANLALVVATGVGPLVLSQSAWERIAAVQPSPPSAPLPGPSLLIPYLPAPLSDVTWSTLSRLALVNQELDDATNPGACVDLARARRLEWVENHQDNCIQPCDSDPQDASKAQNAAAYLELGSDIPVAIVPDSTAFLQGLRAEIRPEGPEIDGLIGASVFSTAQVELDYRSKPTRAVIGCPSGARATCLASPRCPRLSNPGDLRACFGQDPRTLPTTTCLPAVCPQ